MSNASYLKLKDKIAKLEKDIYTLVKHPDSYDAMMIKVRNGFRIDMVNVNLSGKRNLTDEVGRGIIDVTKQLSPDLSPLMEEIIDMQRTANKLLTDACGIPKDMINE